MRITAHAFGENRPARDLSVSPGHKICVDIVGEVLIHCRPRRLETELPAFLRNYFAGRKSTA